jgi:hypothetical protein
MKIIITIALSIALSIALGAFAQYSYDSWVGRSILQSDHSSITRNIEQANALLDVYEQQLTADQQQQAKDSIRRDANGREIQ